MRNIVRDRKDYDRIWSTSKLAAMTLAAMSEVGSDEVGSDEAGSQS